MNKLEKLIKEIYSKGVEYKKLDHVLKIKNGKDYKKFQLGDIPVYGSGGVIAYINTSVYEKPSVLIPRKGSIDKLYYVDKPFWTVDTIFYTEINEDIVIPKYVYYFLQMQHLEKLNTAGGVPSLTQAVLNKILIPIPPLPVQHEIVRILDKFTELTAELTAELIARKKQYEYYKNRLLTFSVSLMDSYRLEEIVNFKNGKGHEKDIVLKGKYIVVNSKFISTNGEVKKYSNKQISPVFVNDVLMVMSDLPNGRALAKCFFVEQNDMYTLNQRIGAFTVKNEKIIRPKFLYYILNRNQQLLRYDNGVDQTNLKKDEILKISIPIPTIEEQEKIIRYLDKFNDICNSISQGLPAEIEARQKQYEYYRDKLLSFKEVPTAEQFIAATKEEI